MISILLQFLGIFIVFFATSYATWYVTEKELVPQFLNYKPFSCQTCLTFWSLVAIYLGMGITFKLWICLIGGLVLAVLNAIAMVVHQKRNTISINDFDKLN